MYVEPQTIITVEFSNKPGDMWYSYKWTMLEIVADPNRRVLEYIYTGRNRKHDHKVEIKY